MPAIIKTNKIKIKDVQGEEYIGVDVVAERTAAEIISDIEEAGQQTSTDTIADIQAAAQTATTAIQAKGTEVLGSIPDTYEDLADQVESVSSAIIPFNAIELLELTKKETKTVNGVTYTWSGNECALSGTATGSGSYYNLIPQEACALYGIIPGQKLDVKVTCDVARLHIRFLIGTTTITGADYYLKEDTVIEVPATATNVLVRLWVSANKTVSETVEPHIMTGITNHSIKGFIEQFNSNPFIELNYLPTGTDLDNATESGWRILSSGFVYTHSPINGRGAMLFTYASGNIPVQIMIGTNTGAHELYTRNGRSGSFVGRTWASLTEPLEVYKTDHKYVAFGDSLTYGAVWSSTQGTELHQVKNEWRIPTRIAIANGFINQYQNEAIGGIGYFKKSSGQNLIEQIGNYTFTGVDLVTIMAGANDKSTYTLGTKDDTADMETICGAIRNIIQTISGKNPKTQIIVIQPPPSGVNGNTQDVWSTIPTGWKWSMNQFDEQVSQLCHAEHVGYLNWWDSTYCRNWKNVGYTGNTGPNYTHPTEDYDYCMMGDYLAGKVASLYHTVT